MPKMELYETVIQHLKKKKEYVSDNGKLKKWLLLNKAQNFDAQLINLLLEEKTLKEYFFINIKKDSGNGNATVWVFQQDLFVNILEQKSHLNNSFTKYKKKVGLSINDKYLNQQNETVLIWPYKDCILEGGQSRAEDKREEVFFNTILAQDEITQLLEPKVLTNAQSFGKSEKQSIRNNDNQLSKSNFTSFSRVAKINTERNLPKDTITDNLIIKGNNLLVLHSLKSEFAGKVKLIYIDPPYNTGNDGFNYNDRFKHSTWLTFMKNRLTVAKQLLKKDGAIFVQCDDKEQAYLKVLMDELFGEENYRETITVKTSTPSGVNAINVRRGERLFKVKEYLLFYSKKPSYRFYPLYIKSNFNKNYRYEVIKTKKGYEVADLKKKYKDAKALEKYALAHSEHIYSLEKNNKKAGEKIKKVIHASKDKSSVIEFMNSRNQMVLIYDGGVFIPLRDRVVKDNNKNYFGKLISDFWDDEVFQTNRTEGGVNLPSGKKPEKLLKRILDLATKENDIVLDFFLGSGTTAAVAHKMNRQYIGIEQLDYGENDSEVRLQNVINGDKTGISKSVNWKGGGEFISLELKKNNQQFIEEIKVAKSSRMLQKIWEKMKANSFLDYTLDIDKHEENVKEFKALSLKEQKHYLFDILDKNQLYVNRSSLEDKDFQCSEEEKKITSNFYQNK